MPNNSEGREHLRSQDFQKLALVLASQVVGLAQNAKDR